MTHPFVAPHAQTLVETLTAVAHERPEQTAYIFLQNRGQDEETITYGQLYDRARAIGATLHQKGYQGQRILLLYPPGLEYIAAFWGCLFAGATAVPAYPPDLNRPMDRIEAIIADATPVAAMTIDAFIGLLTYHFGNNPQLQHIDCIASDLLDSANDAWQPSNISPNDIAFLQYTSGSTALPKGVMVSHANLIHNEHIICEAFSHSQETTVVGWLPLYHDMGLIGNVIQPLCLGRPCILMSPLDFLKKPLIWLETISKYKATTSGGPNFAYELCARKVKPEDIAHLDLSSWTVAFNGAEPIRASTLERFNQMFAPAGFQPETFYPCYGLAEGTLFVTGSPKTEKPVITSFDPTALENHQAVPQPDGQPLVSSGQLWGDQTLRIVDPDSLNVLPDNAVGEIWLKSDSIAQGYWKQEAPTQETFHAYTQDQQGPFLRTGDLGFSRDGELFVTGRIKDLIIIDGRNHYPQDIEYTTEQVSEAIKPGGCAAFAVDGAEGEALVVVARVRLSDESGSLEQIKQAVTRAIVNTHQIRPHEIVLMTQGNIPKTSSGKIQHRLCRKMYLEGRFTNK